MNQDPFDQNVETIADSASHIAERAQSTAADALQTVRSRAGEALTRGGEYVRKNPVPIVFGALGIGVLIGVAMTRRDEPDLRKRYVDEPIHQARDLLYSLLAPVTARLRNEYGHARESAENAADKLQEFGGYFDPMFKQAQRAARKLKFW
jgi:ElaB/YqjD/DUF883 family membrane-anchored ribosome-binding protein